MTFNLVELKPWIDMLANNGVPAVIIGCMWLFTRKRVTPENIEDLKTSINKKLDEQEQSTAVRLEQHASRLTCLEGDTKHMPTQHDILTLSAKLDDIKGVVMRDAGRLEGINRAVDLMNEHLLNRSHG